MGRYGLHRTGSSEYRQYLRSQAWGFRRVRWFRECRARGSEPACQVCQLTLTEAESLDLHHVSYDGITWDDTRHVWKAQEADADLMPMCRVHHQELHQMMDGRKEVLWLGSTSRHRGYYWPVDYSACTKWRVTAT